MINSPASGQRRLASNPDVVDQVTDLEQPLSHHDMDVSRPADSPANLVRKDQQVKARAVAGRHIDKVLAKVPASDDAKASRKAKLIDLPTGTPPKRQRERAG